MAAKSSQRQTNNTRRLQSHRHAEPRIRFLNAFRVPETPSEGIRLAHRETADFQREFVLGITQNRIQPTANSNSREEPPSSNTSTSTFDKS